MNARNTVAICAAVAGTFALLSVATPVQASPILSPVTATASVTGAGDINHTIDHTGLQTNFISGVTDFNTYMAGNPLHDTPNGGNAWSGPSASEPINLDFGLGGTYAIDELALWTSFDGFSINRFTVFTANDAAFSSAVNVGSFGANDTNPVVAQLFALTPSVGSFLRIEVLSDHGAGSVNLGEIAVRAAAAPTAVPEPASLLLLGTGLIASRVRRRFRARP